jgi:hypothetical protein
MELLTKISILYYEVKKSVWCITEQNIDQAAVCVLQFIGTIFPSSDIVFDADFTSWSVVSGPSSILRE